MREIGQPEIDQSDLPDFCRKPTLVLGVREYSVWR